MPGTADAECLERRCAGTCCEADQVEPRDSDCQWPFRADADSFPTPRIPMLPNREDALAVGVRFIAAVKAWKPPDSWGMNDHAC